MDWRFIFSIVSTCTDIIFIVLAFILIIFALTGKISIVYSKKNSPLAVNSPVYAPGNIGFTEDIPDEVVAVIAAAIHTISEETGSALEIKSISPVPVMNRGARPAWATAGVAENTRSF